jgi:hypothetical protein
VSPDARTKRKKRLLLPIIERRRASDEEEDGKENTFARRNDDDTVVPQRTRLLAILALMSSTKCTERMEIVSRVFNPAINFRRFAVLRTRPDALTQPNSWASLSSSKRASMN